MCADPGNVCCLLSLAVHLPEVGGGAGGGKREMGGERELKNKLKNLPAACRLLLLALSFLLALKQQASTANPCAATMSSAGIGCAI